MKRQAHVYISGKVQGVFFRDFVRREAEAFGIGGWVRNMSDGRVEAVFCGEVENVNKMIEKCREGSGSSKVENVEVEWEDVSVFEDFEVRT